MRELNMQVILQHKWANHQGEKTLKFILESGGNLKFNLYMSKYYGPDVQIPNKTDEGKEPPENFNEIMRDHILQKYSS